MTFVRQSAEVIINILFIVSVSSVFFQVIAMHALNDALTWTEELARHCRVWIIILASLISIRKDAMERQWVQCERPQFSRAFERRGRAR